jgi:signal transduction histidine kinase
VTVFDHVDAADPTAQCDARSTYDGDGIEATREADDDQKPDDRRLRELERENDRLGRLLDVFTHDLQNHLAVAEGRLELATREGDDEQLEDLARAHDRMSELIEDLLAAREVGFTVGDCRALALTDCADRAWAAIATGDAALVVDGDLRLRADPDRLVQLLENLFRNAVEHGSTSPASHTPQDAVEHGAASPGPPAGGGPAGEADDERSSVIVTVGPLPDRPGFFVEDDGSGLPAGADGRLFEAGYSTDDEGTGLGLAIVKDVVTGHGWTIEATTGSAGGARFEISDVERPSDRSDDLTER